MIFEGCLVLERLSTSATDLGTVLSKPKLATLQSLLNHLVFAVCIQGRHDIHPWYISLIYIQYIGHTNMLNYLLQMCSTPCPEKNILNIIDYHLKKRYPILIIFNINISGTTGHQMTVQYSTSPNVCFCTTWGKQNQRNMRWNEFIWSLFVSEILVSKIIKIW